MAGAIEVALMYSRSDAPGKAVRAMHPSVTDTIDAVPTTVQIRSGRDSKLPPNLDTDGCALLRSPTSLATHAFYDDATVEAEYYPETCEAVRKHLGGLSLAVS
eukprot:TRINITY_DN21523_c0_g1_i5.p3 TRINITY_DN21523_c0_g1~~TRINITY_DN21523_c0_g1_i5.p3  ORF type:complete len:103 (+),score=30.20 TRINITY_DN21523_c0_g1_i5:37-345(+)